MHVCRITPQAFAPLKVGSLFTVFPQLFKTILSLIRRHVQAVHLPPGHGDNNSRYSPSLVRGVGGVGSVVCGSTHTLALAADGRTVWSFGSGKWRREHQSYWCTRRAWHTAVITVYCTAVLALVLCWHVCCTGTSLVLCWHVCCTGTSAVVALVLYWH